MPKGFILSPTAAQKVSKIIRHVDLSSDGAWLEGGRRRPAQYMPLDVAIRDVEVTENDETTVEQHVMVYLGGFNGLRVDDQNGNSPIPVDQANCPELYQAVFDGDEWYDTGEVPPSSGFGSVSLWLYIADSADWTDKSTTAPSLSWGLASFGISTPDTVVYAVKLFHIRHTGAAQGNPHLEIRQLFHGNVTLPGHRPDWKPLRLFHEYKESDDAPSEWLPENGDSLRAVTAIQRNGSDIQVKYTEVSATSDGRLLFGLESGWYTI